jgi:hypothetical protein
MSCGRELKCLKWKGLDLRIQARKEMPDIGHQISSSFSTDDQAWLRRAISDRGATSSQLCCSTNLGLCCSKPLKTRPAADEMAQPNLFEIMQVAPERVCMQPWYLCDDC